MATSHPPLGSLSPFYEGYIQVTGNPMATVQTLT